MDALSLKYIQRKIKQKEQQRGAINLGLSLCMGLNAMMFLYFLQRIEYNTLAEKIPFSNFDGGYVYINVLLVLLLLSALWARWETQKNNLKILRLIFLGTTFIYVFLYPFAEHLLTLPVDKNEFAKVQIIVMLTFFFLQLSFGFLGCLILLVQSFQFKIHSKKKYWVNWFTGYMMYYTCLWTWLTLDLFWL